MVSRLLHSPSGRSLVAFAMLLAGHGDGPAEAVPAAQATPSTPDTHAARALVDAARQAGGTEWQEAVEFICSPDASRANRPDDPLVEPTRVFDNLYAIGRSGTMVWAITTTEGIILIDAGYADQLESVLLPGMRALGLDPNAVKYVLLGHGHADHFGGAAYFQDRGARVVLSQEDWDLLARPPAPAPSAGAPSTAPSTVAAPPPRPPTRDIVATEGRPISLGGVSVTPVLIPGHTAGSLGTSSRSGTGAPRTPPRSSAARS